MKRRKRGKLKLPTVYMASDIHIGSGKPRKWPLIVNCKRGKESAGVKAEIAAAKARGAQVIYGADLHINGIELM